MNILNWIKSAALAGAILACSSALASADFLYTYTGQDFTSTAGPYSTSDSVTGSFTLSSALGDNLVGYQFTPSSFSFSDGVQTISNTTVGLVDGGVFEVWTNASGVVTGWQFAMVYNNGIVDGQIDADTLDEGGDTAIYTICANGGPLSGCLADSSGSGINLVPGSLTVAAVPEPSTWAMMILGFCALGFMARHRKRSFPMASLRLS